MSELVENAKVEDSDEYNALFDTLKKNDEGEAQDSFESKLVKASLKEAEKGSVDYELLKKVDDLTKEKSTVNKAIKTKELEMKELVAERIVQLTDAEVDQVLYKKWFGSVLDKIEELVKSPLKAEIAVLEELNNRYSETLDSLDDEISKLEKELEAMMKELFPAEGERVPKCRFPGFEGEWEEKKLGEVSEIYDGTHQTPRYTTDGIMFLSVENIKTLKSNKYISEADFEKDFKISPQNGDVLMTRIGDIGTSNVVNTDSKLAFYVSLALIRSTQLDSNFLNTSISSINFQKELWSRTLHIAFPKKINKNEIGEVSILFPSITEQQAIGNFFQKLDKSITLQQQKLDKLKDLKKAYLNELFV